MQNIKKWLFTKQERTNLFLLCDNIISLILLYIVVTSN